MQNKKRTRLSDVVAGVTSRPEPSIETNIQQNSDPGEMLSRAGVAHLLACSIKTVKRLEDAGGMPAPVRINSLRRWQRSVIVEWIAAGCPKRQKQKGVRR